VTVVGLFPGDSDAEKLSETINSALASHQLTACTLITVEDQDWERAWMDDFRPMEFGDGKLVVCPTGMHIDHGNAVIMELDPGLAFGTGTHPTTALCLDWLAENPPTGKTLIDYGCGSGILGIAALLLGGTVVYGVDNDPQALTATRDNLRKNNLPETQFPLYLPGDFAQALAAGSVGQADIMLANILAGPLVSLAQYLSAMTQEGGTIMLSGILAEQASEVMAAYAPWFTFSEPLISEGWVRLTGERKIS